MTQDACLAIQSFLEDVVRNPNSIKIGSNSLQNMIDSMSTCLDSSEDFALATPTNTDYKKELDGYGVVLSNKTNPYLNRPSSIKLVNDEIWISSTESEITRYDENFSYLGGLPGLSYGDPINDNAFRNCTDFSVEIDEITGKVQRVLMVSSDSIAKVYSLDANDIYQLDAIIGTDGVPGPYPELSNCTGCAFLPNNHFIIVNNTGGTNNSGFVSQYTELNAPFQLQLEDSNTNLGSVWDKEVTNPISAKVINDELFISTNRDEIGVYDITDPLVWVYKTVYTKPRINTNTMNPTGLAIDYANDVIVTGCGSSAEVLKMSLSTHDVTQISGKMRFDDIPEPYNVLSEFGSVDSVEFKYANNDSTSDLIGTIVADSINNRIQVIPNFSTITIPYTVNIPVGKKIKTITNPIGEFNTNTMELTISLNDIKYVKPFYIILENA